MMTIKILLIGLVGITLIYFLKNMEKVAVQAWKRIALFGLLIFGIISIVYPKIVDELAKLLGIGRGADLLLYVTVIGFVFVTLNIYVKFREISLRQGKIISKIAIIEKEVKK
jgi:hypothetical protein